LIYPVKLKASRWSALLKAVPAVYRSVSGRLERDLTVLSALGTFDLVHLSSEFVATVSSFFFHITHYSLTFLFNRAMGSPKQVFATPLLSLYMYFLFIKAAAGGQGSLKAVSALMAVIDLCRRGRRISDNPGVVTLQGTHKNDIYKYVPPNYYHALS